MRQLQIRTAVAAMTGIIAALSRGPICAPPISWSDLRATYISWSDLRAILCFK
jgi:hypothetical protein